MTVLSGAISNKYDIQYLRDYVKIPSDGGQISIDWA